MLADHEIFDRIENKLAANEGTLVDPECRQKFFDFCLTKETDLVFVHAGNQFSLLKDCESQFDKVEQDGKTKGQKKIILAPTYALLQKI